MMETHGSYKEAIADFVRGADRVSLAKAVAFLARMDVSGL